MKAMYYIAVLPPLAIREEIRGFKEEVRARFNSGHALRSPAHITLQMPFHFEEAQEPILFEKLAELAREFTPVDCILDGFGHFGNSVIYVDVLAGRELSDFRRLLQDMLRASFGFSERQLPGRFHPHITIANRDLTRENFQPCMDAFKDRKYYREFPATGYALLKHHGDHWQICREFPFS